MVVLDVILPDMSGLDVLRKLREQIPGLLLLLGPPRTRWRIARRADPQRRRRLRDQAVQPGGM